MLFSPSCWQKLDQHTVCPSKKNVAVSKGGVETREAGLKSDPGSGKPVSNYAQN